MRKDAPHCPDKPFCQDVARQVAELFPLNSDRRSWFLKQIELAIEQQKAYEQATQERDAKLDRHYQKLQQYPNWTKKTAGPPKDHSDWVWGAWFLPEKCSNSEEILAPAPGMIEGWGPPELLDSSSIPPEPIHWLYPFGDRNRTPEQVIPAQCLILAVVHDISRRGKGFRLLLADIKLPLTFQVFLDYQSVDGSGGGMCMSGFDRECIELALTAVKENVQADKSRSEAANDNRPLHLRNVLGILYPGNPEPYRDGSDNVEPRATDYHRHRGAFALASRMIRDEWEGPFDPDDLDEYAPIVALSDGIKRITSNDPDPESEKYARTDDQIRRLHNSGMTRKIIDAVCREYPDIAKTTGLDEQRKLHGTQTGKQGKKKRKRRPPSSATPPDTAMLCCADLAKLHHLKKNALQQRLKRWRHNHDDGWQEVTNPPRNQPRFLYQYGAVKALCQATRATQQRHSKKKITHQKPRLS